ncbi:hypothetical protein BDV96DRAFT_588175 [Lophiotrema nucula]|uniref:Zn(2)-C6 fungal-type domain-containing protein n=1 Tax=Lophiotrema nucula TaxID=690887 RepID=A0A6A5YM71_9PLEO|nr:hypothetical protein BDV96DRAFT_588175 [Lophiotrema nucula]
MANTHVVGREKQRRSSKACQACRMNKTKCEPVPGVESCSRCLATSSQCHFLASRRGRIKGSKNLRTLKKLPQRQSQSPLRSQPNSRAVSAGSHRAESLQSCEQNFSEDYDIDSNAQQTRECVPDARTVELGPSDRGQSGMTTPWDPQVLAVQMESQSERARDTLSRSLLKVLGEFPVHEGKGEEQLDECKRGGLQEPMWHMAGLADKGWELNEAMEGGDLLKQANSALREPSLKADFEHLFRKWSPQALDAVEREQRQYFAHGIFASKYDVAPALDPVNHGLVTEERVVELFDLYWTTIHPQWSILDPSFHTPASIRQRSALLTTTILALGATAGLAISSGPRREHVTEARRLHAHVEKINLVVYATGARSVDIVQAQILLSRWGTAPRSRLEEHRWIRAGMIPRMATEIGLTRSPLAVHSKDGIESSQLWKNDLRTRAFLVVNEHRFSTYSGRQVSDLAQFELSEEELQGIAEEPAKRYEKVPPSALYSLFLFDRETRERIRNDAGSEQSWLLDAELEHIKVYIESWMQEWCSAKARSAVNWYLVHEALSCWLLLVTQVAKARLRKPHQQHEKHQQRQQQLMLSLALRLFTEALKVPRAIRTTHRAAIFPFAASIVLRTCSRSDLILAVALQMAGEPGEPHVSTFVRESGIQILLMLHHNKSNSPQISTPETPRGDAVQSVAESQESSGTSEKTRFPSMHLQDINMMDLTETEPDNSPADHWLKGGYPLQPSTLDGMFSFNVDDFPNVPDISQQHVSLQDSISQYYDLEDLDAMMSMSEPVGTDVLQPQMYFTQPTPTTTSAISHNPPMLLGQMSREGALHDAGSNWSTEGISPSSTVQGANSTGLGAENHNAQRSLLLSAVDRLIELAARI